MTGGGQAPVRDGVAVSLAALAIRVAVVIWAAGRFPPAQDGAYYHVVAQRIAAGHGYTWLWPDGAVTYAAHYPVGYPALLGALYAVLGAKALHAQLFNAVLGALGVLAVHRVAASGASRPGAFAAAAAVAVHPGLVLYTGAVMTEGAVGSLLAVTAWLAVRGQTGTGRTRSLLALGIVMGVACLVRPQVVLLAPVFGALALRGRPLRGALIAGALAVAVCAPWTLRNCARMGQCAFVSANGGWNLLIGAGSAATGRWVPIEAMQESTTCALVFDEASKDACFGAAARRAILADPLRWVRLAPAKLAATFDTGGAPAWYLHASNAGAFSGRARDAWASAETVTTRLLVLGALMALARVPGRGRRSRSMAALVGAAFLVTPWASVAWIAVAGSAATLGGGLGAMAPAALASATIAMLAVTHVVFFGASRYALTAVPLLAALAGCVLTLPRTPRDTPGQETPDAPDRDRGSRAPPGPRHRQ